MRTPRRRRLTVSVFVALTALGAGGAVPASAAPVAPAGPAAPTTPAPNDIVALGDSGAAGPGSDREFGDVATGQRYDRCRRSPDSAAVTLARALDRRQLNASCAGSTITDLVDSELDALTPSTRLVTVTTGSNDTGKFATFTQCLRPELDDAHCQRAGRIAREHVRTAMPAKWARVFAEIRRRAPHAHILAIGYAPPFNDQPRYCGLAPFSRTDRRTVNGVVETTNDELRRAVEKAGGTYAGVDFTGHQICDRDPWVNAVLTPTPGGLYHTNSAGQIELGWAALKAVDPSTRMSHDEFVALARSDRRLDRVTLWNGSTFANPSPFLWDLDWGTVTPPKELAPSPFRSPQWRALLRLLGL